MIGPAIRGVMSHHRAMTSWCTLLTIVPSGLKYPHTFLDSGPRIPSVIRWGDARQQRDIHAEGLGSEFAGVSDGSSQRFRGGLGKCSQDTFIPKLVHDVERLLDMHVPRPPALETAAAN